mmetsp:Transcript_3490/g.5128  ORF Transcript_3490/g.5128 Transcript_3490/m.5128 type:complete len:490 (-) Transcript_3490:7-1476(-)
MDDDKDSSSHQMLLDKRMINIKLKHINNEINLLLNDPIDTKPTTSTNESNSKKRKVSSKKASLKKKKRYNQFMHIQIDDESSEDMSIDDEPVMIQVDSPMASPRVDSQSQMKLTSPLSSRSSSRLKSVLARHDLDNSMESLLSNLEERVIHRSSSSAKRRPQSARTIKRKTPRSRSSSTKKKKKKSSAPELGGWQASSPKSFHDTSMDGSMTLDESRQVVRRPLTSRPSSASARRKPRPSSSVSKPLVVPKSYPTQDVSNVPVSSGWGKVSKDGSIAYGVIPFSKPDRPPKPVEPVETLSSFTPSSSIPSHVIRHKALKKYRSGKWDSIPYYLRQGCRFKKFVSGKKKKRVIPHVHRRRKMKDPSYDPSRSTPRLEGLSSSRHASGGGFSKALREGDRPPNRFEREKMFFPGPGGHEPNDQILSSSRNTSGGGVFGTNPKIPLKQRLSSAPGPKYNPSMHQIYGSSGGTRLSKPVPRKEKSIVIKTRFG